MKKFIDINVYSKYNPFVLKSETYELYLQGKPSLINDLNGFDSWIDELHGILNNDIQSLEIPITSLIENTSGLFSLIVQTESEVLLACDKIRSFPLFYGEYLESPFCTDNLNVFQNEKGNLDIDYDRIEEFITSSLVFGKNTIYSNVSGIQAGEITVIRDNKISSKRYFEFKPAAISYQYIDLSEFASAFDKLILFVFGRMIEQNPSVNNWVIPLSGGHDSRLLVNYLYRLGIKNVICFSYGTKNNEQSLISKQVAEVLNYEWHFVEYTDEKWKILQEKGIFDDYVNFSFNGVSTPHLQDFLAVYELRELGIIKGGDIVLPGHTVVTEDVFDINTLKLNTKAEAIEYVYLRNRRLIPVIEEKSSTYLAIQKIYDESRTSPENFLAYCDWQERQSKFITNSIKTYEFFGLESSQPMWDKEIVDFWMKIPSSERIDRGPLYVLEKRGGLIDRLMQIPFAGESNNYKNDSTVNQLKKLIPDFIIILLVRISRNRVTLNEGLNTVFAKKAKSVRELLDPINDFPKNTRPFFRKYLYRFPYQMDYNILTTLYTIRKVLDRNKTHSN